MPFDTVLNLLLREERRALPASATGDPLGDAAAALGAGEAKRATAILLSAPQVGDAKAVAAGQAKVAAVLDHNWFPGGGGAVLAGDLPAAFGTPMTPATDPEAVLVLTVAHQLVAATPAWRSIADGARRTGGSGAGFALAEATQLLTDLIAEGHTRVLGPAALVLADLHVRAGSGGEATVFQLARLGFTEDPLGLACCALAELDAQLPGGRPETLGEDLEGIPGPEPAAAPELIARYRAVSAQFATAGSDRGVAAVALRESRLAFRAGGGEAAAAHLVRARTLAAAAGDTALVQLASVHAALLDGDLGRAVDAQAAAGPIIAWATTVGSTSWARGLARLCRCRAERWRDLDAQRARDARRLAETLAAGVGAERESALVRREQAAAYGATNFWRAAVQLLLGELAEAKAAGDGPFASGEAGWAGLVDLAVAAHRDAAASEDADALLSAADPLRWLLERAPTTPLFPEITDQVTQLLADAAVEWRVLVPLYRGTGARDAGFPETAASSLAEAFTAAAAMGSPPMLTATVLATLRRFDDAVAIVEPERRARRLPDDLASALFLRLGRLDLAVEAMAALPPDDPGAWDRPAERAELAWRQGRLGEAAALVERAMAVFERRLEGLPRDVLRTAALDSWPVARLYATAVGVHAALGGEDHLDRAFALSDRSRGTTLTDLVDADRLAATPEVAAAVRDWQRAGAELGRTVEELANATPPPAEARARTNGAERDLDVAEAALAERAPELFRTRRRLPVPATVRQAQQHLSPGTLLVQYHAFDDRIVVFTVTRDSASVRTTRAVTGQLTCDVRRFHRAVADPGTPRADIAELGTSLAERLLDPVAAKVDAHTRIVVVPSGGLATLPFHVLPWGDGSLGTGGRVVSYLPAVSALPVGRPGRTGTEPLVVGDPAYAASGPRRLPGTAVEAHEVAALHGVEPLTDDRASRDAVLERLRSASLVHLATHGFLRESAPYSAYLALAGIDRLTVPDLMGLGLNIDLAVLSACDSGRGRATAAGDVLGLTRALLGSGVRGLVVSLWPVDDVFACLTMIDFQERLLADPHLPPAEALAASAAWLGGLSPETATQRYESLTNRTSPAERRLRTARDLERLIPGPTRDDPAHPSSWAPFVYVGAP